MEEPPKKVSVVEKIVTIASVDEKVCEDELFGVYDRSRGECRILIREDKTKPGQVQIVRLFPEKSEL